MLFTYVQLFTNIEQINQRFTANSAVEGVTSVSQSSFTIV